MNQTMVSESVLATPTLDRPAAVAMDEVRAARELVKQDREHGFQRLTEIFRAGRLPDPPPDGRYLGALVALDFGPRRTTLMERLVSIWLPWKGKRFDAAQRRGDNIFTNGSRLLLRLGAPRYRGIVADRSGRYRAFVFDTYAGPGQEDPDRQVLKLDYDRNGNPRKVRQVVDELIQIGHEAYLGKAHLQVRPGEWRMVAFFSLEGPVA